ncbi:MAG: gliding motility-associated C-terminal domain-containing protein [Bacteroidia bacterium]|nr:gliding motility-associated C-terminal domain-containing protein [Bacteroidia bacterium]
MKYLVLLCFALFSAGAFAQTEICNNAIDDDGDGLIDLNDSTDCVCNNAGTSVSSLIPNASFEAYDYLPTGFSQMDAATGWTQATQATSDYFNHPSYNWAPAVNLGLVPPPDGVGYVGCHIMSGYIEYVGACLSSPMLAGTNYKISFQTAAFPTDGGGGSCNGDAVGATTIDLVIYGNASCAQMPVMTMDCPILSDPSWVELGRFTYTPGTSWSTVTITFTPTTNINVIMLGGPCSSDIPAGFASAFGQFCYPYFVFDDLVLNESSLFAAVSDSGTFCGEDKTLLASNQTTPGSWQWYYEGVAMNGENGQNLDVIGAGNGPGLYNVVYTDTSGACVVASIEIDNPVTVDAGYSATEECIGKVTTFTASATTNDGPLTYNWDLGDNSASTDENPTHTYANAGQYNVQVVVTTATGCQDSITQTVTVNALPEVDAGEDLYICGNGKVTLSGSGAATYTWDNDVQNGVEFQPAPNTYTVTGTDSNGCVNTDQVKIDVAQSVDAGKIPNIFTPDGDSMNDIYTTDQFKECTSFECTIYNRWGVKLYQTNDVLINWAPGSIEDGVYFATIFYTDCNGKQEKHEQHITIFQ